MSAGPTRWRATPSQRRVKRAADVALALGGLVALCPVMASVAAALSITHRGSPLFRQRRAGFRGEPFTLYKFKTMIDAVDGTGRARPDAERITRLGALLRKTSVDELPELFNVLRGDMSLVGPRPLLVRYLDRYDAEQAHRHDAPVGLTGWAQIHGRNAVGWDEKFALDLWYVDHWSLWLDVKILLGTVRAVLDRRGISAEGAATMGEFLGRMAGPEGGA